MATGTYGSATNSPYFTVNSYGHITSAGTNLITPAQTSVVPDPFSTITTSWNVSTDENAYIEISSPTQTISITGLSSGQTGVLIVYCSVNSYLTLSASGYTLYIDDNAPVGSTARSISLTSGNHYCITLTTYASSKIFFNIAKYKTF